MSKTNLSPLTDIQKYGMYSGKIKTWPEEKTVAIFNIACLIKGINI